MPALVFSEDHLEAVHAFYHDVFLPVRAKLKTDVIQDFDLLDVFEVFESAWLDMTTEGDDEEDEE